MYDFLLIVVYRCIQHTTKLRNTQFTQDGTHRTK